MTRHPVTFALAVSALSALLAGCTPDGAVAPGVAPSHQSLAQDVSAERRAAEGITIVLDVTPDGAWDVPFTSTGKKLNDFTLDDDADPTRSNTITFPKAKPGTYTVQMGAVVGVTLQTIACASDANGGDALENNAVDVAAGTATIQLERGEAVTCTFIGAGGWQTGDFLTYRPTEWGAEGTAADELLRAQFNTVYPSSTTPGVLEVGIIGSGGYSMAFNWLDPLLTFLPPITTPGQLDRDLVNPSSSSSGTYGGEVVALQLNVDFAGAGITAGAADVTFGDLTICNVPQLPLLTGLTVRQFLATANTLLGGGTGLYELSISLYIADELNRSFSYGTPTQFAQDNLVAGACP